MSSDDDGFWSLKRAGYLGVMAVASVAIWIQAKHGEVNPDTIQTFVEAFGNFINPPQS
jgi:hypothetical protein